MGAPKPTAPQNYTADPLFGVNPQTGMPYSGRERRDTMAAQGRPQMGLVDPSWDAWFDKVDQAGFNATGQNPAYRSDTMKFGQQRGTPRSTSLGGPTIADDPGSTWQPWHNAGAIQAMTPGQSQGQGQGEGDVALAGLKSALVPKKPNTTPGGK